MITRARRGLIVIGNTQTLRGDPTWCRWLDWASVNGLVVGGSPSTSSWSGVQPYLPRKSPSPSPNLVSTSWQQVDSAGRRLQATSKAAPARLALGNDSNGSESKGAFKGSTWKGGWCKSDALNKSAGKGGKPAEPCTATNNSGDDAGKGKSADVDTATGSANVSQRSFGNMPWMRHGGSAHPPAPRGSLAGSAPATAAVDATKGCRASSNAALPMSPLVYGGRVVGLSAPRPSAQGQWLDGRSSVPTRARVSTLIGRGDYGVGQSTGSGGGYGAWAYLSS